MPDERDLREKSLRMLVLLARLQKGELISKPEEAQSFGVSTKTIQRDIEDLRYFLGLYGDDLAAASEIVFDPKSKRYQLSKAKRAWLLEEEVLAVCKVLLECRGFSKTELTPIIEKLLHQCRPEDREHIQTLIRNELFHYTPVGHQRPLVQSIWELSRAIKNQRVTQIIYRKEGESEPVTHLVEPVGTIFSEYYFYLLAYIHNRQYDFPTVFRFDRIERFHVGEQRFRCQYAERFQEGEFRKRVQFMQSGKLMKIRFRFWGRSLEAVCDRLPTAQIISQEDGCSIIGAEVFGTGIKMWLLSQAQYLEVLSPPEFREEMKKTINEMANTYNKQP